VADYVKHFNAGRPVVLIGQSQGAIVLRRLISREIDRKPKVRALLISALLMGGNVLVPQGKDVGGDFKHIRACRSSSQIACVVACSTFNEPPPPTRSLAARPSPGDEVLCTDPAALAGGSAPVTPIYPSAPFAPGSTLGAASQLVGIPRPDVPTTWIAAPNSYDSTCQDADGADVMQISPLNGAPVLTPIPDANWGLHLTDALGNNIALLQRQFRAYERRNAAK
jgi:Protein of unknown function (DUF3089)